MWPVLITVLFINSSDTPPRLAALVRQEGGGHGPETDLPLEFGRARAAPAMTQLDKRFLNCTFSV